MGQDFLLYLNHVGLCTEEISEAGEAYVFPPPLLLCGHLTHHPRFVLLRLGNAVQGFTSVLFCLAMCLFDSRTDDHLCPM